MGTISYLCGLLCLVAMLGHRCPDGHLLKHNYQTAINQINNYSISNQQNTQKTNQLLAIAKSQVGIREATGNNDGERVEQYLHYTGNKKGEPWCAAFVSWVFGQVGLKQPRTAWSPALFPHSRIVKDVAKASIFGIYFANKGRIAHVGLVESHRGDWLYTIEGNTNIAGSREGDGVYRKLRHQRTIKAYANWLSKEGRGQ